MTGSIERRESVGRRRGVGRGVAKRRCGLGRRRDDEGSAPETPADHIRNALQLIGQVESGAPTEEYREDARAAIRRLTLGLELLERHAPPQLTASFFTSRFKVSP